MCDYSLHACKTRTAEQDDQLVTCAFPRTMTHGLKRAFDPLGTATCLLPGAQLVFEQDIRVQRKWTFFGLMSAYRALEGLRVATFRQLDLDNPCKHHDALELTNGEFVYVNDLQPGQFVRVLQLPVTKAPPDSELSAEDFEAAGDRLLRELALQPVT